MLGDDGRVRLGPFRVAATASGSAATPASATLRATGGRRSGHTPTGSYVVTGGPPAGYMAARTSAEGGARPGSARWCSLLLGGTRSRHCAQGAPLPPARRAARFERPPALHLRSALRVSDADLEGAPRGDQRGQRRRRSNGVRVEVDEIVDADVGGGADRRRTVLANRSTKKESRAARSSPVTRGVLASFGFASPGGSTHRSAVAIASSSRRAFSRSRPAHVRGARVRVLWIRRCGGGRGRRRGGEEGGGDAGGHDGGAVGVATIGGLDAGDAGFVDGDAATKNLDGSGGYHHRRNDDRHMTRPRRVPTPPPPGPRPPRRAPTRPQMSRSRPRPGRTPRPTSR